MKLAVLLTGLFAATALQATPVYDNTTTDTLNTVVYSTGPYTEIGDRVQLAGTERIGQTATAEFFNGGASGSFDAVLNVFGVVPSGSGVGNLLGTFSTSVGTIGQNAVLDVSWALGGLNLPDELIFTVAVNNVAQNLDLGLTVFDPPSVGSSSSQFFLLRDTNGYATAATGLLQDNIFFRLDASSPAQVPEPVTSSLVALALVTLLSIRARRATRE